MEAAAEDERAIAAFSASGILPLGAFEDPRRSVGTISVEKYTLPQQQRSPFIKQTGYRRADVHQKASRVAFDRGSRWRAITAAYPSRNSSSRTSIADRTMRSEWRRHGRGSR